jgi:DNA-binding CsgD family transcriptional regulator
MSNTPRPSRKNTLSDHGSVVEFPGASEGGRPPNNLPLQLIATVQGDQEKAMVLLEESFALSKRLGDKSGIAASLIQLGQLLVMHEGDHAREVEVLRLVARGMTNAQIAKELYISPRTVNAHLGSVYHKIGSSTRAEATRFAIEHDLL